MKIDKDSRGTILTIWAVCIALFVLLCLLVDKAWALYLGGLLLLAAGAFGTYFFRVPDRSGPGSTTTVTSVADGEVVIIDHLYEKDFLKRECIRISVYMDFMNVHANFWPVTGEVIYCQYHPGKHKLAFLPKSSDLNEHATTAIRTPEGKEILFKQIAGTFARRVVSYSKVGMPVKAGEQCGIIKLGSRIDFFLPLDATVKVDEGDIVRACETVIAEL
jgi:phosphatidylserine decarboxylase